MLTKIRDGDHDEAPVLERLCGTSAPSIVSTGSSLHLRYVTVSKSARFNATWESKQIRQK